MLPYIRGNEVWGIAKIYDSDAAKTMASEQLSTSPAVIFRKSDGNIVVETEDGKALLIEGDPSLLDHLAICADGVWDKGGDPAGVELPTTEPTSKGSREMTEIEENVGDAPRADSSPEMLDKVLKGIDALCGRMDAYEKRLDSMMPRKDGEDTAEEGEDAAEESADGREDAQEPTTEAERGEPTELAADAFGGKQAPPFPRKDASDVDAREAAARADSNSTKVLNAVERLARSIATMPKSNTDEDYASMADMQARADSAYSGFGARAPGPMQGETVSAYRIRLARGLQSHSTAWSGVDLKALPTSALAIAEEAIYADAATAARSAAGVPEGHLREIRRRDGANREITEFVGDPNSWMGDFRMAPRVLERPYFSNRSKG